jgi:hypothetical protein
VAAESSPGRTRTWSPARDQETSTSTSVKLDGAAAGPRRETKSETGTWDPRGRGPNRVHGWERDKQEHANLFGDPCTTGTP